MITVIIRECRVDGNEWRHNARTHDKWTAVERAVQRHFGQSASYHSDASRWDYGQIFACSARYGGAHALTDRVSVQLLQDGRDITSAQ